MTNALAYYSMGERKVWKVYFLSLIMLKTRKKGMESLVLFLVYARNKLANKARKKYLLNLPHVFCIKA